MNYHQGDPWEADDDPGPLVRPFAVTRGRAGKYVNALDMLTLVVAVRAETEAATLDREYAEIVRLCQGRPISIAELAAHLNLLLAAVKVLIGDLVDSGHVIYRSPTPAASGPDPELLQAVLDGIRRL
ncbi:DUF742 domain-containing protein [Nocardia sp. alder85J]|uniref:DUF742 domain-containing protein n=1 Tax=Nocardia sp. alder85J TaxID=2862949 RepID=UPI001CD6C69B|nr:DUF742 domain-containing protein [Nocardia sp. alder85J]MCX4091377.1 DUF742 domain-containing protein [Nocardia sp. alder85J]